jgi:hypothetical protein
MEMYSDKNEYTKFELPLFRVSLEWYKKYTNSNIIGFYITPSKELKKTLTGMFVLPDGKRAIYNIDMNTVIKKFKTDNYLRSYNRGYSNFYFIPGDTSLNITNDELEIPD